MGSLVLLLVLIPLVGSISIDYYTKRQVILETEKKLSTGGNAFFTAKELKADEVLMKLKNKTIADGVSNSNSYAPSMHFFRAKPIIDNSSIFRIIKALPKGSVLHLHNNAAVSSEWIIKNLTYRPEAKLCEHQGQIFFTVRKTEYCPEESLKSIQTLRARNGSVELFDAWLESFINLKKVDPKLIHADINTVWMEFEKMFSVVRDLLNHRPFFEAFHMQLLKEFYEDNVLYIELRIALSKLYDFDGKTYDEAQVTTILANLIESFKQSNPGFVGAKVIFSKHRGIDSGTAQDLLKSFVKLNKEFPKLVVGFDLVGQEDINKPLTTFLDELQQFRQTTPYFFHAGETNGYGSEADLNLIDAVLLDTRRIGHGFSLYKHPVLRKMIKSGGIALEICPISNQVLRLVDDLRNHPAVSYVSESIPIVISADDPGFWDSKGVSYDFYYALMAIAPSTTGIGFLKQIVWDSVRYSSLTSEERTEYSEILQPKWEQFLDDLIAGKFV
ncbi:adenosine deaminase 2-like [Armigeres subalbatus]|uniref:adenosine deaminase 2-like n=1 Tax=Armigeres subalbatus TaxID=124917 RepID=UPI002ED653A6